MEAQLNYTPNKLILLKNSISFNTDG